MSAMETPNSLKILCWLVHAVGLRFVQVVLIPVAECKLGETENNNWSLHLVSLCTVKEAAGAG